MASSAAIRVEGLSELRRGFKKMDGELGREYRDRIKGIAGIVADEAKSIAESKGLEESGKLIKSIKPGTRGTTGLVRAGATRNGYPYPAVWEYRKDGKGRPFMTPALEHKRDEVVDELGKMLDDVFESGGFRKGTP